jgi:hypothetical protein
LTEDARQANFIKICERCRSKCCYHARPPLTKLRAETISRYLKERGGEAFLGRGERYSHPEERDDGYCTLFDPASGLCRVHPVKPETCVAGPVTFDINLEAGKIEWYLKAEKICPLAGELARDDASLSKHLEAAKREIMRLVDGLEGCELLAILEIEEEETFKIGEDPLPERVLKKLGRP